MILEFSELSIKTMPWNSTCPVHEVNVFFNTSYPDTAPTNEK
jgi:hypothetical protein